MLNVSLIRVSPVGSGRLLCLVKTVEFLVISGPCSLIVRFAGPLSDFRQIEDVGHRHRADSWLDDLLNGPLGPVFVGEVARASGLVQPCRGHLPGVLHWIGPVLVLQRQVVLLLRLVQSRALSSKRMHF